MLRTIYREIRKEISYLISMDLETLVSTRQAAYDRWNSK